MPGNRQCNEIVARLPSRPRRPPLVLQRVEGLQIRLQPVGGAHKNARMNPETLVQRQLDAYNARDIGAIVATYADDAEQFEHPSTLLAKGSAQLRERFAARFKEANLHAALLHRIVLGNTVIDHERVTRTFPEGPGHIELVAIYEVRDDKITTAWFIAGPKNIE